LITHPIIVDAVTFTRIWNERQRVLVLETGQDIQRGDQIRIQPNQQPDGVPGKVIPALVTYLTTQAQMDRTVVIGFDTLTHLTDEQLMSADFAGWQGRVSNVRPLRSHDGLTDEVRAEVNRLAELIRENSVRKAPLSMIQRCNEFKAQLHAIHPEHPLLKGWSPSHE
jgi:hypothetical protein